ncbi:MAG: START domain-containing protein [Saprospiraceae bacterium]
MKKLAIHRFLSLLPIIILISISNDDKGQEKNLVRIETLKSNNGYNALDISFQVKSDLESFTKILCDVEHYSDWVYKCMKSEIIAQTTENNTSYKSYIDFPFPLNDRIYAVNSIQYMDKNNNFISESKSIMDKIDPEGFVPINYFVSKWVVTPSDDGWLKIKYYVSAEPGGAIPAFLYNIALKKGPSKTIENFIDRIETLYSSRLK